jgi:hypothetical protein
MGLQVYIPEQSFFTLYARGSIEEHTTVPGKGTFIRFEEGSAVILFYKYPHHRRAYIVRAGEELRYYRPVRLPQVKGPVGILLKAKGRRVDILRRAYFNLEQINGLEVYRYRTRFWQHIACLIDNYNGHRTAAVKSSLIELSRRYRLEGLDG